MAGKPNDGVYCPLNLSLNAYGRMNPVRYVDPDGNSPISVLAKQIAKKGLKEGMHNCPEKNIQRRLGRYMSPSMKKQFMKDVESVLGTPDSSALEIAFEMIPVAGDIRGTGKFAKKTIMAYDKLQDLEKVWRVITQKPLQIALKQCLTHELLIT